MVRAHTPKTNGSGDLLNLLLSKLERHAAFLISAEISKNKMQAQLYRSSYESKNKGEPSH